GEISGIPVSDSRRRRWRPAKMRGHSVSSALSRISFRRQPPRSVTASEAQTIGRKAAQERFSEESLRTRNFPETYFSKAQPQIDAHTAAKTHSVQQAWMNSRNPTTIASAPKHRQPMILHPTDEGE